MKMHLLIVQIIVFFTLNLVAEPRTIQLEWEPDLAAISYQVEIGKKQSPISFQTFSDILTPKFLGFLEPGEYWMRVRGLDDRKIYGSWSDKTSFTVKAAPPVLLLPQNYMSINSLNETENVKFKWKPLKGSDTYNLVIVSEKSGPIFNQNLELTEFSLNLKTADKYKWFVQALDEHGNPGEKPIDSNEFVILGPALKKVNIIKPYNKYVRDIKFEANDGFNEFRINFLRFNLLTRSWVDQGDFKISENAVTFPKSWPGGRYQIVIQPLAQYRNMTQASLLEFDVVDGDRSRLAENLAYIRESIERTDGIYFNLGLQLAPVEFKSQIVSQNQSFSFSAMAQYLLLGLGYLKPQQNWGFYINSEHNLVQFDIGQKLFSTYEISAIYRFNRLNDDDIQLRLGYFSSHIPEFMNQQSGYDINSLEISGASLGLEYWKSLNPKWAYSAHFNFKYGLNGQTYSGHQITDSSMMSLGLQGAYKYNSKLSVLAGYAYRNTEISYNDVNTNLDVSSKSKTQYNGHFLNLSFEYTLNAGEK